MRYSCRSLLLLVEVRFHPTEYSQSAFFGDCLLGHCEHDRYFSKYFKSNGQLVCWCLSIRCELALKICLYFRFIAFYSIALSILWTENSVTYLMRSGESSLSFLRNLLMVSSMVLPILSLISPNFSLKLLLFLSQSSSQLLLDSGSNRSPAG